MTKEYCPRFDYTSYEPNTSFYGSLVSSYSQVKHLIYCVDSKAIKNFIKIDEYKLYKKLAKRPALGSFFVYFSASRKSYYRAFNLGTNPVEPTCIKSFFFDTGEVHYLPYESGKFFYLPDSLCDEPMAIFCKVNSYPKKYKSIFEFVEYEALRKVKFYIREKTVTENELGTTEDCLIVDIKDINEDNELDVSVELDRNNDAQVMKLTKSALLKFESVQCPPSKFQYEIGPFMAERIPMKTNNVQLNEKVILHPGMMVRANLFYGICKSIQEVHNDIKTLTTIMTRMNRFNVVHERLGRQPRVNEVVVVCDKIKEAERYYRGKVLEIYIDVCIVLYVDYGYTRPIKANNIFKFPTEFAKFPFHYTLVHVSNVEISEDARENHKNMIIVSRSITPFGYGIIETIDGFDIAVKLFDCKGINMKDVIAKMTKQLRLPKKI